METAKIEKVPHGTVLRNSKNAVFITARDMKELKSHLRYHEYDIIGQTFVSTAVINGVLFMDLYSDEYVHLNYEQIKGLINWELK